MSWESGLPGEQEEASVATGRGGPHAFLGTGLTSLVAELWAVRGGAIMARELGL